MDNARLDKIIADGGACTRSGARALIKAGRVTVNGRVVNKPDAKADPAGDDIRLDGGAIGSEMVYIMLNKPAGTVSATRDGRQPTVLGLLPAELRNRGVFPVGRLDKDTQGLLILTNDGEFCHAVTSPKKHVPKVYAVHTDGTLDDSDAEALRNGIMLRDGTKCLPAELTIDIGDPSRATIRISEGKYHQVKRMFAALGKPVTGLERLAVGGLRLDVGLKRGEWRMLNTQEIESIFVK